MLQNNSIIKHFLLGLFTHQLRYNNNKENYESLSKISVDQHFINRYSKRERSVICTTNNIPIRSKSTRVRPGIEGAEVLRVGAGCVLYSYTDSCIPVLWHPHQTAHVSSRTAHALMRDRLRGAGMSAKTCLRDRERTTAAARPRARAHRERIPSRKYKYLQLFTRERERERALTRRRVSPPPPPPPPTRRCTLRARTRETT